MYDSDGPCHDVKLRTHPDLTVLPSAGLLWNCSVHASSMLTTFGTTTTEMLKDGLVPSFPGEILLLDSQLLAVSVPAIYIMGGFFLVLKCQTETVSGTSIS